MLPASLQQSVAAVSLPDVQEMIRRLGQHGLAVTIPHIHKDGTRKLPQGMVQVENGLSVSFEQTRPVDPAKEFPTAWQYDDTAKQIRVCGICSFCN